MSATQRHRRQGAQECTGREDQRLHTGDLGNGRVCRALGGFGQADSMFDLGWATMQPDISDKDFIGAYGGLGLVYHQQGDFDRAEALYKKALSFDWPLARKEAVAAAAGTLGRLYKSRGDSGRAREMLEKSARIYESLDGMDSTDQRYTAST